MDFIGLQSFVGSNQTGVIGICGFGGYNLSATSMGKRIKAVATTSMYVMCHVVANGWENKMDSDQRSKMFENMGKQR